MMRTVAAVALLTLANVAHGETLTLRTVDFEMPSDIAEKIPGSVNKSDIFVSSDNCYYVRKDLSFVWIGCVG